LEQEAGVFAAAAHLPFLNNGADIRYSHCCEEKTGRAEGPAKIAEGLQAASNLRKLLGS